MNSSELLDIACVNLQYAIKNARIEKDYAKAWRRMGMTSSVKRRLADSHRKSFCTSVR